MLLTRTALRHESRLIGWWFGLRLVPWVTLAACAVAAFASVLLAGGRGSVPNGVRGLRLAAMAIAVGGGLCFDDDADELLRPAPTPRWSRFVQRVVTVALPLALTWWVVVGVAKARSGALPTGAMTVELGAFFGVALLMTAIGAEVTSDRRGSLAVIPGVIFFTVVLGLLRPAMLSTDPGDEQWRAAHFTYAAVAACGLTGAPMVVGVRDAAWRIRGLRRPGSHGFR